ncbi:CAP-associated domain-containing protein [Paenibacillus mesophilus]|uniref:CAP-associated domain-containing protein n=1 Tax=Paenibacillus mesophilus TaxID=2582849 RepID=UPI001EE3EEEF|nr:CAP-associated domain-containing protein [Paenibacillus mesophilus]
MKYGMRWKAIGKWSITALLALALPAVASYGNASFPISGSSAAYAAEPAPTAALSDIRGHWGRDTIEWAVSQRIVDGFADGTFKPDKTVSEAEYLTMLLRAYVGNTIAEQGPNALWYAKYYAFAAEMRWPVDPSRADAPYKRGQVARLLAASQGQGLDVDASVRYLLDNGLAQGRTSGGTTADFGADETLTRAEAVQFVRNMKGKAQYVTGLPAPARTFAVRGVSLGDSAASVQSKLGAPARVDPSEYGFVWHIYNQDYSNYAQVGIQDGKVVGLYTNSADWTSALAGIGAGATSAEVVKAAGKPLDSIKKGSTRYMLNSPGKEDGVYEIDDGYVTFYYDTHVNNTLEAIQIIAKSAEEAKKDYYGSASDELRVAFEKEVFDLANAARAKRGLKPFQWDDTVAGTARKHSEDMAKSGYFDHTSPAGLELKDRFKADGISYSMGAENIAAGQPNAISAHSGWLNSTTGHRKNLLGETTRLGVGVYFGGSMRVYYTQNFYTPRK